MAIETTKKNNKILPDILAVIKDVELFSGLGDEDMKSFADKASFYSYPKGKVLFIRDEPADYFYLIISGWVKLFRETLDGDEAVIDVLTDGHIFGETSIFEGGLYPYGAQVIEDAEILMIPTSVLEEKIKNNITLSMNMLGAMSRYRKQQDNEIEHRTLQNAPQRIGCFLLRLCKADDGKSVTLHLPYDKMLIASRLGMKPETFSRSLATLAKNTGINVKGSSVQIDDIERLTGYSCNACSNSYPCHDL